MRTGEMLVWKAVLQLERSMTVAGIAAPLQTFVCSGLQQSDTPATCDTMFTVCMFLQSHSEVNQTVALLQKSRSIFLLMSQMSNRRKVVFRTGCAAQTQEQQVERMEEMAVTRRRLPPMLLCTKPTFSRSSCRSSTTWLFIWTLPPAITT